MILDKGGEEMNKLKRDNPKITFRPDDETRQKFRKKCFDKDVSQDSVLIKLIRKWTKNK